MQNSGSCSPERASVERRGRVRRTVLALCAIGMVISRSMSAQLLVDPLEVTLLTAGSDRVAGSFSLTNTSDAPAQATISRSDWDRAENGDNRFLAAGSTGKAWGQMRGVAPASGRIGPHSSRAAPPAGH